MVEQTKLQDMTWTCTNSVVHCDAVLPCFRPDGKVDELLVLSRKWGWLIAPTGALRRRGSELQFDGPLENLVKLSTRVVDRLEGLYHFDPGWLAKSPSANLSQELVAAVARTNLAGATFERRQISEVVFDEHLNKVEHVEVGSSLWRRRLTGPALTEWLSSDPTRRQADEPPSTGLRQTRPTTAAGEPRRSDFYQATDGPLKLVSLQHRAGGGRATIGQYERGQPGQEAQPVPLKPAEPATGEGEPPHPRRAGAPPEASQPPPLPPDRVIEQPETAGPPVGEAGRPPPPKAPPPPPVGRANRRTVSPEVEQVQRTIENIRRRIKRGPRR